MYAHRIIQYVNTEDEEVERYKRKTRVGVIKVSGFSHKRAKKMLYQAHQVHIPQDLSHV